MKSMIPKEKIRRRTTKVQEYYFSTNIYQATYCKFQPILIEFEHSFSTFNNLEYFASILSIFNCFEWFWMTQNISYDFEEQCMKLVSKLKSIRNR